jgi:hypothetical protein
MSLPLNLLLAWLMPIRWMFSFFKNHNQPTLYVQVDPTHELTIEPAVYMIDTETVSLFLCSETSQ